MKSKQFVGKSLAQLFSRFHFLRMKSTNATEYATKVSKQMTVCQSHLQCLWYSWFNYFVNDYRKNRAKYKNRAESAKEERIRMVSCSTLMANRLAKRWRRTSPSLGGCLRTREPWIWSRRTDADSGRRRRLLGNGWSWKRRRSLGTSYDRSSTSIIPGREVNQIS